MRLAGTAMTRVAWTLTSAGEEVSTILLIPARASSDGIVIGAFETIVFAGRHGDWPEGRGTSVRKVRYATLAQARAGHEQIVHELAGAAVRDDDPVE